MATRRPEVAHYRRGAAQLTDIEVLAPAEKTDAIAALPLLKRKKGRQELELAWAEVERTATSEAQEILRALRAGEESLRASFAALRGLGRGELVGPLDGQTALLDEALEHLDVADDALARGDFGGAGRSAEAAQRELNRIGGPLVVALNGLLQGAVVPAAQRASLSANLAERQQRKVDAAATRGATPRSALLAAIAVHASEATGYQLAADVLGGQKVPAPRRSRARSGGAGPITEVLEPSELERFDDVGGLDDVKERLASTIGSILARPDAADRYQVVYNGILFHGPPGTGKTMLARALAGEYGLRFLRVTPAAIGSALAHETAANLLKVFEQARKSSPCVLFLDEIDSLASDRSELPGSEHREVVTQLMGCLEDFRSVPGLVILAATNDLDRLDSGLREGRFDLKIPVPLPDAAGRASVLEAQLEQRADAVDWDDVDVDEIARLTAGRNSALLAAVVSEAAQDAMTADGLINQARLRAVLDRRGGTERTRLEEGLTWDDVVLLEETRERIYEVVSAFENPETARKLGVKAPAGLLLHGPPGTGKTTVAKVLAGQVNASFFEASAADLLSKWAGESEQRVAKLFERARAARPSIVFIDEIDGLLRRRGGSASGWEERVVSQFLRELDGLRAGEGVLLVGATNRLDIIDDAIVGRRLVPVEVGLPDRALRRRLLEVMTSDMTLGTDVDLAALARSTEGMSGADLRRLRDGAGMKALARATKGSSRARSSVTMADFQASLKSMRTRSSLTAV